MKEKLFALFWVLFFALPLYAQADKTGSYSIKGQVLDSLSNESVPYATLRIALAKTLYAIDRKSSCRENIYDLG